MKKLLYTTLLFAIIPLAWSCSDGDEKGTTIPKGWKKNTDLATYAKHPWYLHRSGADSIIIDFFQYSHTADYGSVDYWHYKKKEGGGYSLKVHGYLREAYSIEQNKDTEFYGLGSDKKQHSISYANVDDQNLIIYSLPKVNNILSDGWNFGAVEKEKLNVKTKLLGGWYNSQVVDSTVIVFDSNTVKEYVFVRGTAAIQNSWEYGEYTATRTNTYLKEELLQSIHELKFAEFKDDNSFYYLRNEELRIYWKSPRKAMTYKRIKK